MRTIEVRLSVAAFTERDEVKRVVVCLYIVNVMYGEFSRARWVWDGADLAGVQVASPYFSSQAPVELSRPLPATVAVDVSRIAVTPPPLRCGQSLLFRPILAHLLSGFGAVFAASHVGLGFAFQGCTHGCTMPRGALVSRTSVQKCLAARRASLDPTANNGATVYALPNFGSPVHVCRATKLRAKDVPLKLRRATRNWPAASGAGLSYRHRTTQYPQPTVYHCLGGRACD